MESKELYEILINFDQGSMNLLGFEEGEEYWIHPNSTHHFQLRDDKLSVYIEYLHVHRLDVSFDNSVKLYRTLVETDVILPATHLLYLRKKGLNV